MTHATLKSHNQTPRKVRLVTELVKGKKIGAALAILQFLPKRAAEPITKLIKSAAASASEKGENPDDMTIQSITVESAGMLKKYMPRAFWPRVAYPPPKEPCESDARAICGQINFYDAYCTSIRTSSRHHSRLEESLVRRR